MIAFLRHLIFHDFWLKLFALVLAILIRITVTLAIQREVSPALPLTVMNEKRTFINVPVFCFSTAEDVRSVKVKPSEVEVTVQGDAKIVPQLQAKEIRAIVELTGIESARDLRKKLDVSMPVGITLVRVIPEEVEIIVPPKP